MEELAKRVEELERRVQHLEAVLQYQARKNKWALLPSNQYLEYQKGGCLPVLLRIFGQLEYEVGLMEQQYLEQSMFLQLMEPISQFFL